MLLAFNTGLSIYYSIYYTQISEQNRIYEGKYRNFRYDLDDSLPFLSLEDDPSILLDNPDRGFRMESYITLGTNLAYPSANLTYADEADSLTSEGAYASLQNQITLFASDKPRIIQQYVYLTLYTNTSEIPTRAFDQLTSYFEHIRSLNLKLLLRFAYTTEGNLNDPTQEIMIGHIHQLKQWFSINVQLVADVVYCLQFGFIGFWGEGHSYHEDYEISRILGEVFEMVPEWMYINVRTLDFYYEVPGQYRYRAGIHDDYLVGTWHIWNALPNDPYKRAYYREVFKQTINDGELPWGSEVQEKGLLIKGCDFIQSCIDYSFSTLSIVHDYIGSSSDNPYTMYRWKSEYLNAQIFNKNEWNFNPHLLDNSGQISIFEYLKYHLGYQLVLSNFTMKQLSLLLKYSDNSTKMMNLTFTPHGLNYFGQFLYNIDVDSNNLSEAHLKLTNSRNGDYVRFGNKIPASEGFYRLV
jgi:hypothetical protein